MMTQKISSILACLVDLPLVKDFITSKKCYRTLRYCVVRAKTNEGYHGYGEAREASQITGESGPSILDIINHGFGPALKDLNPFDIEEAHLAMSAVCTGNTAAKSAVDMALYDLMGKIAGVPTCSLLGGKKDSKIQTSKAVGLGHIEDTVKEATELVSTGFTILKLKTGVDPQAEIKMIRDVRQAVGPDIRLKLDANQGWTLREAVKVLSAVEDCDIEVVEQPLPAWDLKGSAELRKMITPPVMLDEGVHSSRDILRIVETGAADMVNIKLLKTGGLFPAVALANVAEAAGLICQVGSLDTTVGTAAAVHLALAKRNIRYAEVVGPTRLREDIARGLSIAGEWISVPDKPGLGIDINTDMVDFS